MPQPPKGRVATRLAGRSPVAGPKAWGRGQGPKGSAVSAGRQRLGARASLGLDGGLSWALSAPCALTPQGLAHEFPDPAPEMRPKTPHGSQALPSCNESPVQTSGSQTLLPFPFSSFFFFSCFVLPAPALSGQPSNNPSLGPPVHPHVHRSNPRVPDHMTVSHSSCSRTGGLSGAQASSSSPEQEPLRNPSSLGAAAAGGVACGAGDPDLVWPGSGGWPLVVAAGSRRGLRGRPSPVRGPTLVTLV